MTTGIYDGKQWGDADGVFRVCPRCLHVFADYTTWEIESTGCGAEIRAIATHDVFTGRKRVHNIRVQARAHEDCGGVNYDRGVDITLALAEVAGG